MALRLGCLALAALCITATACGKDKKEQAAAADLDARCALMAKACGDKDKHQERITEECKGMSKSPGEKGCASQAMALYDCWEKDVCSGTAKVWTLDDLKVLAKRHNKCVAQAKALEDCTVK
jgi:hypothetical protein